MICRKCGLDFDNTLTHCPRCGNSAISNSNNQHNNSLLGDSIGNKTHQWNSALVSDCKIETRINLVSVFGLILFGCLAYSTISWLLNPPSTYSGGFVGTYFLLGTYAIFILFFMTHILLKSRIIPCPYCNTSHNVALNSVGFMCSACGKRIAIIDGKIRKAEELE